MVVSDALSRLHIEAEDNMYNMTPLNLLQHVNTAPHIHHNYDHLVHSLYRQKQNNKEVVAKPKRGCLSKLQTFSVTIQTNLLKPKDNNSLDVTSKKKKIQVEIIKIATAVNILKKSLVSLLKDKETVPSQLLINFRKPVKNTFQDKFNK